MTQKHNILFLMNGSKPPRGGEYLTLNLVTQIRRAEFHPFVIYAEEGEIVREIKKTSVDTVQIPLSSSITSIYPRETKLYNPLFVGAFIWRLLFSGAIFKLKKFLKNNNIHLIYCADNLSKLIGGIAGKMVRIKVVAHCHDDFKEDVLGKTMRVFYLLLLNNILTVSKKVSKFFMMNGRISPKVITIYNGIDADIFNPGNVDDDVRGRLGLKKNSVVIGSIGMLEPDKGQKYLIDAIVALKSEGFTDNLVCVICGTGPEEGKLKEYVNENGMKETVMFLGYQNDIPGILKMLDILVITSLTIESFSMSAVEAMSMQVPVIATNVGGLPEVVDDGKTGFIIPPRDAGALSNSIKYLIRNTGKRLEMGKNGRDRVLERFTIEENIRKTEEVFLSILRDN